MLAVMIVSCAERERAHYEYKYPSEEVWPLELSVQEVVLPSPASVTGMCHRDAPLGDVLFCHGRRVFSPPPTSSAFPLQERRPFLPHVLTQPQAGPLASRTRHGALMPPETGPPVPLPLLGASARTLPSKAGLQLLCVKTIHEPAGPHATRALGTHASSHEVQGMGHSGCYWLSD